MQLQISSWIADLGIQMYLDDERAPAAAADAFSLGAPVLICDDSAGELVAELCIPAESLTTENSAFLVRHTSGIITATVDGAITERLDFPLIRLDFERDAGRFCVAVDVKSESTGISARDRACTIGRIADAAAQPTDFDRPGHVIPVLTGGVLARTRWTRYDAAAALSLRAGLCGVVASASLVHGCGATTAPFVASFARTHRLPVVSARTLKSP